jgi:branched-chain amino acid transport system substrate-binding protein
VEVVLVADFGSGGAGAELRNGLQLEADAINAAGGVLGATVDVVAADGQRSADRATELVRQEVGDPEAALVVGPDTTAAFLAARPALASAATPNCVVQVSDAALAGAGTSFESGPSQRTEVAALLNGLHRARPDLRAIGLLDAGDELSAAYDAQLAAQAGAGGLSYVGHVDAGAGADQRAALQQLAGLGAQVVVLALQPAEAERAAQAAAQLGGSRPLLAGFASLADPGFPVLGGDAAVGALIASSTQTYLTSVPQAQWPVGYRTFVAAATRQYGLAIDGVRMQAAPVAADCLVQWASAAARAGTFRPEDVTRAWRTLDVPAARTVLGVHERLTPADHSAVAAGAMFVYTWARDGARLRLHQVSAPGG